jgi:SAM-dependent methyltransferase
MRLFAEKDIIETYNQYVLKDVNYFNKVPKEYSITTPEEKSKLDKLTCCRVASIFDFKDWIKKYNLNNIRNLLVTCQGDPEIEYINFENITVCHYDSDSKYDLHLLDVEFKDHDFIIFNQTLEHLYNPFIAMQNLYDHLKPGGFLYTTVPTINVPHMLPFHFWGITPISLCMLAKSVGFEIRECGFWGNLNYVEHIFKTGDWPNIKEMINTPDGMKNDSVCQAQTWILVQK